MTALLLNLWLLGKPRQATPSPDKVVDAVLCYWPDVPRLSPLVRLPNMSTPAQEPRAGHTLGVFSLLLYGSSGMS